MQMVDPERTIELSLQKESSTIRAFTRKRGRNNVTVDDLVDVITPKGRASVPDSVKAELLQRIRSFLCQLPLMSIRQQCANKCLSGLWSGMFEVLRGQSVVQ
ncbi:hypothetical protein HHK36_032177 [Tetracentron sinense]|uniref:Enhancer of yellow 2 transcription factor homolog n=1 Tax=Tetracentron sinense TaxID=13715 RepID=A0A835CXW7_TETSI|nr:hypothetical protein HHK36_032177 [Tetracentron sinense]